MLAATPNVPVFDGKGGNPGVSSSCAAVVAIYPPTALRIGEIELDRSGFTVEDRDRSAGLYFVRYVDPKLAAISVMSQVAWMQVARPAIGIFVGAGPGGPSARWAEGFADHAAEFALAALRTARTS